MRDKIIGRLRVVDRQAHPPGMEPLAQLLRDAMDAEGLTAADVARLTKLSHQHVSTLLNRSEPYTRPPTIKTLTALERIKGLTPRAIADAVARSTGIGVTTEDEPASSSARRSAHALIDKFTEEQLPRVVQVLIAMLD